MALFLLKHPLLFSLTFLVPISFTFANSHEPELFVVGGGLEDKENVAKYVVSIQETKYIKKYFGYFHKCGGSVIGKRTILTAAHCIATESGIKLSASLMVVVVGIRNRFKTTSKTRIMQLSHLITHEGYNLAKNNNTANDIGLIILKENLEIDNDMIGQIGLTTAPPVVNERCVIVGWGRVFNNGPLSAELSYADVRIFSPAECEIMNRPIYSSKLICAGDPSGWKTDACQGDSGGPLICAGKVVGIVSSGFECASPLSPGLYTDVYQYLKWIENQGNSLYVNCLLIVLTVLIKTM